MSRLTVPGLCCHSTPQSLEGLDAFGQLLDFRPATGLIWPTASIDEVAVLARDGTNVKSAR